jgi:hypothetical protein
MAIGTISPLNAAEARDASAFNLQPRPMARAWEYWTLRLGERGKFPPARRATAKASAKKSKAAPRKRAAAKKRKR